MTASSLNPLPDPRGEFVQLAFILIVATAVNATAQIRNGKSPGVVLVSATVLFVILAITGNLWRYDIVMIMAVLFLVSSLVINGKPFIDGFAQFLNGVRR